MGCFSFLCSECEHPINSDSSTGEHCILFLLEEGEVLEWMQGQYSSYGHVFQADGQNHQIWQTRGWSGGDTPTPTVCDLMHNDDWQSGIAAYHSGCFTQGQPEVSDSDPEQGWGRYQYTTKGEFRHETARKVEPVWKAAK